jgi:hypothetical protein
MNDLKYWWFCKKYYTQYFSTFLLQGRGFILTTTKKKNEFLGEYVGEIIIISNKEGEEREELNYSVHRYFVQHTSRKEKKVVVDCL